MANGQWPMAAAGAGRKAQQETIRRVAALVRVQARSRTVRPWYTLCACTPCEGPSVPAQRGGGGSMPSCDVARADCRAGTVSVPYGNVDCRVQHGNRNGSGNPTFAKTVFCTANGPRFQKRVPCVGPGKDFFLRRGKFFLGKSRFTEANFREILQNLGSRRPPPRALGGAGRSAASRSLRAFSSATARAAESEVA